MKIKELLTNIESEENTCKNLEERLGRINSIKINIEFPATKEVYDPPSGWGSNNAISDSLEDTDKVLFKKFKDIYFEYLNNELKRHKENLNKLLNKKEQIEKFLSE